MHATSGAELWQEGGQSDNLDRHVGLERFPAEEQIRVLERLAAGAHGVRADDLVAELPCDSPGLRIALDVARGRLARAQALECEAEHRRPHLGAEPAPLPLAAEPGAGRDTAPLLQPLAAARLDAARPATVEDDEVELPFVGVPIRDRLLVEGDE